MDRFKKRYEKQEQLGEGTYGVVYRALDTFTQQIVAVKRLKMEPYEHDDGIPATAIREFSVLKRMKHRHIVRLLDVNLGVGDGQIALVFEYHPQDLRQLLKSMRQQQLPPLPLVYYQEKFYELLEAVDFCHSLGILHRDLKPQNILVSREGELKVADWGLARTFRVPNAEKTQEIVTLWYRAPEILLGENCYTVGVDMWSVGCILAEFITRRPLFASDGTQIGQLFKIFQCTGTPTDQEWPQMQKLRDYKATFPRFKANSPLRTEAFLNVIGRDGVDLIESLLQPNPAQRLNAMEALQHPFFASYVPRDRVAQQQHQFLQNQQKQQPTQQYQNFLQFQQLQQLLQPPCKKSEGQQQAQQDMVLASKEE